MQTKNDILQANEDADQGMERDTLTEKEIDQLQLVQAVVLCEKLQIDSSQCTTLAEIRSLLKDGLRRKERLQTTDNENVDTAEVHSNVGQMSASNVPPQGRDTWSENTSDEISDALVQGLKKQNGMKSYLMDMYEVANSLFDPETILEGLKDILTETKSNYPERLRANYGRLVSEDCPIVITGETSAGKSTLINLLIGEEILPYSVLHKTTAICCLHHSATKRLVYDESGHRMEHHLDKNFLAKDLSKKLDEIMENTTIKLIDIYWPILLLENQEKVTLVDTPGLGDNEEMAEILLRYLPNAVGFIYVLNSANAGGIENNKILRILGQQISLERNGENVFDVSNAIFVCNKWDQVPPEEDAVVMKYIQEKLEECMTLANKSMDMKKQVLRFSGSQAISKMRGNDAVTADFAFLLKTIKDLVSGSLERKYIQLYRWLRHSLLENIYETASTHLRYTWTPLEERRKLQGDVGKRLVKLRKKCKEVYDKMEKEGGVFCKSVSKKLHRYLHSREVSQRLRTWTESQVPSSTNTNLAEVIERAIMERIRTEITYWQTNETEFQTDFRNFKSTCSSLFKSLEKEMEEVQFMIEGAGRINDLPVQPPKNDNSVFDFLFEDFNTTGKVAVAVTTPLWLPICLVLGMIGIPVMGIGSLIKGFAKDAKRAIETHTLKKAYEKDERVFMERATASFLKEQITLTFVEKIIFQVYYGEYMLAIGDLYDVSIPEQIEANNRFLDNIITDGDSSSQVQAKYRPLQQILRNLLSRLILFRLRFLGEPYVDEADIEWKGMLSSGSVGNVQKVEYRLSQSKQDLAMKTLSSRDSLKLREIDILLTLKHTNIVETFGVMFDHETEIQSAAINIHILMELCEDTAEFVFFQGRSCSVIEDLKTEEGKDALRLFTDVGSGICMALKYMHENGVLHGNFKLGKILISNHQAKLTGMGSVAYECAVTKPCMTGLSHFAPELFIGKPYYISSDVYSLGIALWEMWFGRPAFSETELQSNTPAEFASKLVANYRPDTNGETTPADKLWKEMQSCLESEFAKRPKIEQILNALTAIGH